MDHPWRCVTCGGETHAVVGVAGKDTDCLAALLHENVCMAMGYDCREQDAKAAARLIAAGVTLAPTPPDALRETWRCPSCRASTNPMGWCQKCDVYGLRYEAPTPPDALREAAQAVMLTNHAAGLWRGDPQSGERWVTCKCAVHEALRAALEAER